MARTHNLPIYLRGFEVKNTEGVLKKIALFVADGPEKLHVILDFDRTLTARKRKEDEDITTWNIMKRHLPSREQAEYAGLFNMYRPKELDNSITSSDATAWWEGSLRLLIHAKVNLVKIEQELFNILTARPGTKELFALCKKSDIPTVILSAGIKNVIDLWAKKYNINPTLTLSTLLYLDQNGVITGWDKKSLIHVLNKKEVGHEEFSIIKKERPNTIVIGDALGDAEMAQGETRVIRIRIHDPRFDEKHKRHIVRKKTFPLFDLMIEGRSLTPLVDLLKHLT